MTIHVIKVPDVGEGVAEVELVSWSVDPGDRVTRNQVLAEVMTDKANVEIPSPAAGMVTNIHGDVGGILAVGMPLVELDLGRDAPVATDPPSAERSSPDPTPVDTTPVGTTPVDTTPPASTPPASAPVGTTPPATTPVGATPVGSADPVGDHEHDPGIGRAGRNGEVEAPARASATLQPGERPRAAPAVRHRAREAGVDLRGVAGTGPAGRITHEDLDAHLGGAARGRVAVAHDLAPAAGSLPAPGPRSRSGLAGVVDTSVVEQPIVGVRRRIAKNMLASTQSIPHITYVEEVDVTAVEELRATLNEQRPDTAPRLTLLPFLIRAMVNELPAFPSMNAHVDDEAGVLRQFGGVHVGIATQTPSGLMVPVVRHAEGETLWSLADRIVHLAAAARDGTARRDELVGSTITVTSLGPLGGVATTPVINKPEVAIIGVNKISVRPVWIDGAFVPRKIMNLSSSFDHRVVDGWDAATFVQALRRSLEQPALLFVDRP